MPTQMPVEDMASAYIYAANGERIDFSPTGREMEIETSDGQRQSDSGSPSKSWLSNAYLGLTTRSTEPTREWSRVGGMDEVETERQTLCSNEYIRYSRRADSTSIPATYQASSTWQTHLPGGSMDPPANYSPKSPELQLFIVNYDTPLSEAEINRRDAGEGHIHTAKALGRPRDSDETRTREWLEREAVELTHIANSW